MSDDRTRIVEAFEEDLVRAVKERDAARAECEKLREALARMKHTSAGCRALASRCLHGDRRCEIAKAALASAKAGE